MWSFWWKFIFKPMIFLIPVNHNMTKNSTIKTFVSIKLNFMTRTWKQFITIFNILQDHYGFSSEVWQIEHIRPWQSFLENENIKWNFLLLGRLHREEMVWHETPKMEIIIGKLSSNSTCMSASVENKTMKCFKNYFSGGFVKCSLPMKLREATQFTPFNFYPFHSQMLTVV